MPRRSHSCGVSGRARSRSSGRATEGARSLACKLPLVTQEGERGVWMAMSYCPPRPDRGLITRPVFHTRQSRPVVMTLIEIHVNA